MTTDRRSLIAAGLTLVTALLTALPTAGHAAAVTEQRVVVTFAPGTTAGARADTIAGSGRVIDEIDLPSGSDPRRRANATAASLAVMAVTPSERAALRRDPSVVTVEDDVRVQADRLPADPGFALATGLRDVGIEAAWDITVGGEDVVIAIIDSGVDAGNIDFAGKVLAGRDFVNDDNDPEDDNGHGTAVASIAAATANNGYGVAGACWNCRIMPIKALGSTGSGYLSDAARGIAWAVEHGADIVNLSLSGKSRLYAMDVALEAAEEAGVVVVASAGNSSTDTEHWPAAHPLAVAVAAVDGGARAGYSNHGAWVDIAAPGCNPAGKVGDGIREFCGTSSAAPLTAGVAALIRSANPSLHAGEVRQMLTSTADPLGGGLGAGRVNARDAVSRSAAHRPTAEPAPQDDEATDEPADPYAEPPSEGEPVAGTPGAFRDIDGNVHRKNIMRLAKAGITSGCDAGRYCPADAVTRGQIATFLDRALDLPSATATFNDVPAGHAHAAGIAAVSAAGITRGCGADAFCPDAKLTRGQMASLLDRPLDLPDGPSRFIDVPAGHPHRRSIARLAAAGITSGCTGETFCPDGSVTRGQMASFLVRALEL